MTPVELRTARLVLSPPTLDDVDAITRYCQDPLFERFLTTRGRTAGRMPSGSSGSSNAGGSWTASTRSGSEVMTAH